MFSIRRCRWNRWHRIIEMKLAKMETRYRGESASATLAKAFQSIFQWTPVNRDMDKRKIAFRAFRPSTPMLHAPCPTRHVCLYQSQAHAHIRSQSLSLWCTYPDGDERMRINRPPIRPVVCMCVWHLSILRKLNIRLSGGSV